MFRLALAAIALASPAAGQFLGDRLPLSVLSVSPGEVEASIVTVSGKDALTVVFSRPVIALGSDFSVPFNLFFVSLD